MAKSKKYLLFLKGLSRARVNLSNMRANLLSSNFTGSVFGFGTPHAEVIFSNYQTTTNQPMITKSILPLSLLAIGTGSLLADDAETKAGYY